MVVKNRQYKATKHIMTNLPIITTAVLLYYYDYYYYYYFYSLQTIHPSTFCHCIPLVILDVLCIFPVHVHMSMDVHMDIWTWIYGLSCCPLTRWRILVPYIPFYVYDCNRPLAPIPRQKMVLLVCDVYLLQMIVVYRIEIPGTHFQDQD